MRGKMYVRKIEEKKVGGFLPTGEMLDSIFNEIEAELEPLLKAGEATSADVLSLYTKEVIAEWYIGNAPKGLALGNNTCCHGAGVQVTSYKVYYMERNAAHSPEDFRRKYGHYPRVFMRERGRTVQIAVMRGNRREGLGRMNGDAGWDITRDVFGFALASFRHNFQALLGVFVDRPSLPCSEEWHLPNLVYSRHVQEIERKYGCRIVEPPVAVPPASYKFRFLAPTPMIVLAIGTKCPRKTKCILQVWDANKKDVCDPLEVEFPKGESETVLVIQAPIGLMIQSGFFNINPINSEMTVSYVDVLFPPL